MVDMTSQNTYSSCRRRATCQGLLKAPDVSQESEKSNSSLDAKQFQVVDMEFSSINSLANAVTISEEQLVDGCEL